MILVVASIDVHGAGEEELVGEDDDADLHRVRAAVHNVAVEEVWVVAVGRPVLSQKTSTGCCGQAAGSITENKYGLLRSGGPFCHRKQLRVFAVRRRPVLSQKTSTGYCVRRRPVLSQKTSTGCCGRKARSVTENTATSDILGESSVNHCPTRTSEAAQLHSLCYGECCTFTARVTARAALSQLVLWRVLRFHSSCHGECCHMC